MDSVKQTINPQIFNHTCIFLPVSSSFSPNPLLRSFLQIPLQQHKSITLNSPPLKITSMNQSQKKKSTKPIPQREEYTSVIENLEILIFE